MVAITKELKVGPGEDFTSFTSAVIDAKVSPHVITFSIAILYRLFI